MKYLHDVKGKNNISYQSTVYYLWQLENIPFKYQVLVTVRDWIHVHWK